MSPHTLPDTRPFPAEPVKNNLLVQAGHLSHSQSAAQRKLALETLAVEITRMLQQNFYLELSVAMSMAADAPTYRELLSALDGVLQAKSAEEIQWFALPVILVAGCGQAQQRPSEIPLAALRQCLSEHPHLSALADAQWLPHFVNAGTLSGINAGQWFAAKQNAEAARNLSDNLAVQQLTFSENQSVQVVFAVGYGNIGIQTALGRPLQNAGLPLMQVFQEHLGDAQLTLFANPLSPDTPLNALTSGSHTRQRMAMDVFSANAIRAIRLQSHRVGAVIAAQAGGRILFGFNAADSAFETEPQIFTWQLSSGDDIQLIQQNFCDLMAECRVDNLYLLHQALSETDSLPDYARAVKLDGHNPLFAANTQ